MVGSAILRKLREQGAEEPLVVTRAELDLTHQGDVIDFLQENRPDTIIVAAAKVGGIEANRSQPAEFLFENLAISDNLTGQEMQTSTRPL